MTTKSQTHHFRSQSFPTATQPKAPQYSNLTKTALKLNHKLYKKYSSSQNYYYTRDINAILSESRSKGYIFYKDCLQFLTESEELRRFYLVEEFRHKLTDLAEYYKFHREIPRIFAKSEYDLYFDYHDKKRKIEFLRITNLLKEEAGEDPHLEKKLELMRRRNKKYEPMLKDLSVYIREGYASREASERVKTEGKGDTVSRLYSQLNGILMSRSYSSIGLETWDEREKDSDLMQKVSDIGKVKMNGKKEKKEKIQYGGEEGKNGVKGKIRNLKFKKVDWSKLSTQFKKSLFKKKQVRELKTVSGAKKGKKAASQKRLFKSKRGESTRHKTSESGKMGFKEHQKSVGNLKRKSMHKKTKSEVNLRSLKKQASTLTLNGKNKVYKEHSMKKKSSKSSFLKAKHRHRQSSKKTSTRIYDSSKNPSKKKRKKFKKKFKSFQTLGLSIEQSNNSKKKWKFEYLKDPKFQKSQLALKSSKPKPSKKFDMINIDLKKVPTHRRHKSSMIGLNTSKGNSTNLNHLTNKQRLKNRTKKRMASLSNFNFLSLGLKNSKNQHPSLSNLHEKSNCKLLGASSKTLREYGRKSKNVKNSILSQRVLQRGKSGKRVKHCYTKSDPEVLMNFKFANNPSSLGFLGYENIYKGDLIGENFKGKKSVGNFFEKEKEYMRLVQDERRNLASDREYKGR
jgi:hypothetical protein